MQVLFNSKFLNHNVDSVVEGVYRIKQSQNKYEDMERNGKDLLEIFCCIRSWMPH